MERDIRAIMDEVESELCDLYISELREAEGCIDSIHPLQRPIVRKMLEKKKI